MILLKDLHRLTMFPTILEHCRWELLSLWEHALGHPLPSILKPVAVSRSAIEALIKQYKKAIKALPPSQSNACLQIWLGYTCLQWCAKISPAMPCALTDTTSACLQLSQNGDRTAPVAPISFAHCASAASTHSHAAACCFSPVFKPFCGATDSHTCCVSLASL